MRFRCRLCDDDCDGRGCNLGLDVMRWLLELGKRLDSRTCSFVRLGA